MPDTDQPESAAGRELTEGPPTPAAKLVPLIGPAILTGIGSSLVLLAISEVAERLDHLLWDVIPGGIGIGDFTPWWIIVVLTVTGAAVGLVVWKAPGHAGPDPATTGLVDPPVSPLILPGLTVATILALAGGVSLGPENPITMINIALAWWIGHRFLPSTGPALWVSLAAAGTIGALFGTPLAAALILSELPGPGALWDRLFAPLIAAVTGSMTTLLIVGQEFVIKIPGYPGARIADVGWSLVIGALGAAFGLAAVYAFPLVHRTFRQIPHPVAMLTVGGLVLGALGALGGHLTLFKGLDEAKELALEYADYSFGALLGMAVVKLVALVIAASCGFRGGRIFPAVFAAVALGFAFSALFDSVPPALSVTCAVLGVLMAVTRQGWMSLFTAAVLVPDTALLPMLCVAALPAWLLVTGRPEMQLPEEEPVTA
ncbi:ion channel protein [Kitasatospora albolonga]|uniref:ion channel protein n=1 Tax=Kitasatospora albolonga TaxID=68173 RepID=UPI00336EB6F6